MISKETKKEPIRVLQCGLTSTYGGIEALILEVYRNIDRSKIQFDFLTSYNGRIVNEDEINELGGRIFKIQYSKKDNIIKHYTELDKFFKKYSNEFEAIHMNSCFPKYSLPLKYAKKYNIKTRIFHSHNSGDMFVSKSKIKNFIKEVIYNIERYFIIKRSNVRLACSKEAGQYIFKNDSFQVINNGIDINKFRFNAKVRKKVRDELELSDTDKVVGFVGRLQYQKNPMFALKVLNELVKKDKNYKMLIIGVGNLEDEMKRYVAKKNISKNVFFLGRRNDVHQLYQAMDYFLFPSVFEGLGIALIEAETSGLHCFASDTVPQLTKVTSNIKYLSIKQDEKEWANIINNTKIINREDTYLEVEKNKFSINDTINSLINIYKNDDEI